jgi:hypothetical protein
VHPTFFSLGEQWEKYTQRAQRLPRRHCLIQVPEREQVRVVRTPTVPERALPDSALESLTCSLAKQSGRLKSELEEEITRREQTALEAEPAVRYYEKIEA